MCDSLSEDSCSNCNFPTSDHQCCSLCPITNKRCNRNAVPGLSRCQQHHNLCKSLYKEYKELCKDLFDTDFKDLDDEQFYKKYKDLENCVNKRKEQTRICYPPNNRETDYKGCYFNPKHDQILERYEHKIKKFKKRFDMIKNSRKKEYKSSKEKELKSQFEEIKQLDLLRERLSNLSIEKKTPKKKTPKKKKKKTRQEIIKQDEDISDILDQAEKKITENKNNCQILTENGKLCYNTFYPVNNENKQEDCRKYCVENKMIWLKELFKNPPNSVKFLSKSNKIYFANIDQLQLFNMKQNKKVKDDVFIIKYKHPFNGEKIYTIQNSGSSKTKEVIDHDEFINRLTNDFEHEIVIKVVIDIDYIKDLIKFFEIFGDNENSAIVSFLNNALFKPQKSVLHIYGKNLTFNYSLDFGQNP